MPDTEAVCPSSYVDVNAIRHECVRPKGHDGVHQDQPGLRQYQWVNEGDDDA
jgi:hypothetical protein